MQYPKTVLTCMWKSRCPDNNEGDFFIDADPDIFVPLVNYLRDKTMDTEYSKAACPSVDDDYFAGRKYLFDRFIHLVKFYGLFDVMYGDESQMSG